MIGIGLSLLWLISVATRPPMPLLGREPGTQVFRELDEHPDDEQSPASWSSGWTAACSSPPRTPWRTGSARSSCRTPGVTGDRARLRGDRLHRLAGCGEAARDRRARGARRRSTLRLARVKPAVREVLGRDGVLDRLGADKIHGNVSQRGAGAGRPTMTPTDSGAVDQSGSALHRTTIRPVDTGQRQGLRFPLDRIACGTRETAPGLDGHRRLRASPRPDDLALDEDGTRPDPRGPERASTVGVGDKEFAVGSLKEEVGVAAREEPRGRRGPRSGAERRLVAGEDPRVADRCPHGCQRPARARRTPRCLDASGSPPTRRTPRAWWGRRCAGTGARARGARRAGRPRVAARSRWSAVARRPNGSRPFRSVRRTGAGWGVRRARSPASP